MKTFDNLILCGRGGCGKSEFIDFLKNIPSKDRLEKFHVNDFDEIDDFPWLHSLFKDEDIWEQLGYPRTLSKKRGEIFMSKNVDIYKFLMLKFNQAIEKMLSATPDFYDKKTLFIEFARGGPVGYKTSLDLLSNDILKRSVIFYLDNTFEESLRRNTYRSTDDDPNQTILNHKVPFETMELMYKEHDWYELTGKKPEGLLDVKGTLVPFVTVWNIPESHDFEVLEKRYGPPLKRLWEMYEKTL